MNILPNEFLEKQLTTWPEANEHYRALANVQVREIKVKGIPYRVQFNPARIVSSRAQVDAASVAQRPCFLCSTNRPPQQKAIRLLGHYDLLVNPFPIFPRHFTLVETSHVPQRIRSRLTDMLALAQMLTGYTIFYNGPQCGASAPDHAHFQAGCRGFLPIEAYWEQIAQELVCLPGATLYRLDDAPRTTFVIRSNQADQACQLFNAVYQALPLPVNEEEPRLNLLTLYEEATWTIFIFPRTRHRPSCYYASDEQRMVSSPGSVDMGGVFILPIEKDFLRITSADIEQIVSEVCLSQEQFQSILQEIKDSVYE